MWKALKMPLCLTLALLVGFWIGRLSHEHVENVPVQPVAKEMVDEVNVPPPPPPAAPVARAAPTAVPTAPVEALRPAENSIKTIPRDRFESIRDVRDLPKFLNEVRFVNGFDLIKSAKNIRPSDEMMRSLNGRFSGAVQVEVRKRTWWMEFENNLHNENGKLWGAARVLLSENGKVFSDLSGSGDQSPNYQAIPQGILVKASPTAWFQLYFIPNADAWVGHYYEQQTPTQILHAGTVRLQRD